MGNVGDMEKNIITSVLKSLKYKAFHGKVTVDIYIDWTVMHKKPTNYQK